MYSLEDFAKAFQLWEEGYRANPTEYMTHEQQANAEVSELSKDRAEYFMELLKVKE